MPGNAPVILKGNLAIGTSEGTAVDVSDVVTGFTIMAARDIIAIKPTLSKGKRNKAGGTGYSLKVDYLVSDQSLTDDLFSIFWASFATPTGELYFEGSVRDGAVGAANPQWQGLFIVNAASLGGGAETVLEDSNTFPMVDAPTRAVA